MSDTPPQQHRFDEIFDIVRAIPAGKVMSYGQVAECCQATARMVGWALSDCGEDVPWQRVVGADGYLRVGRRSPELMQMQRQLLAEEGVEFLANGSVDMERFRHVEMAE